MNRCRARIAVEIEESFPLRLLPDSAPGVSMIKKKPGIEIIGKVKQKRTPSLPDFIEFSSFFRLFLILVFAFLPPPGLDEHPDPVLLPEPGARGSGQP